MGGSQDLSLRVLLQAVDSGASSIVKGFGSVLGGLSGPAGLAVSGLLALGSAAIGIGVASVQAASQYQASMNMVQALTGASSAQMAQYDSQLKTLAVNAGVAPTALAKGLYNVLSAGYQGAQAMQVLTLATEDSKIGMTDAATTTEALTNVLANFSWQTKDANQVNGIMLQTVTLGKATFQQYASTISKAATVSQQYKISLQTMSAAWATMTANGISAGKASTDYQQLVGLMYGKVDTLTKSLKKNGIAFNEAQFNSDSFGQKIQYLQQLLGEASKKHVQLTGVTLQAAQAITVIGGHFSTYNNNLKTLSNSQQMAQKTQQAWAITQSGFAQTMSRVSATVQVLLIDIGQQLLPVLTQMANAVLPIISNLATWVTNSGIVTTGLNLLGAGIKGVVGFITNLVTGIGNVVSWFQKNQVAALALLIPLGMLSAVLVNMAVTAIVAFIGTIPELVGGFIAWATAAGAAAIATLAAAWPVLLIGAAIGLLIGIIILLWTHWSQVTTWLQNAWNITVKALQMGLQGLGHFFATIWSNIVEFFKTHIALIISIVTGPLGALVVFIVTHWSQIVGFFTGLWDKVLSLFTNFSLTVGKKVLDLVNNIKKFFSDLPGNVAKIGQDMINGLANIIKNGAATLIQDAKNMASGIAGGISSFLHFSKPDTGPLATIDQWMPHFGDQLSAGMKLQLPKIQASANLIAHGIAGSGSPSALAGSIPYGRPPAGNSYNSTGINHYGNNSIVINGANQSPDTIAKAVMNQLNQQYRRSGVMSNLSSGGRSS